MITMIARPTTFAAGFRHGAGCAGRLFAGRAAAAQELESFDPDQAYAAQDAAPVGGIDGDLVSPATQRLRRRTGPADHRLSTANSAICAAAACDRGAPLKTPPRSALAPRAAQNADRPPMAKMT